MKNSYIVGGLVVVVIIGGIVWYMGQGSTPAPTTQVQTPISQTPQAPAPTPTVTPTPTPKPVVTPAAPKPVSVSISNMAFSPGVVLGIISLLILPDLNTPQALAQTTSDNSIYFVIAAVPDAYEGQYFSYDFCYLAGHKEVQPCGSSMGPNPKNVVGGNPPYTFYLPAGSNLPLGLFLNQNGLLAGKAAQGTGANFGPNRPTWKLYEFTVCVKAIASKDVCQKTFMHVHKKPNDQAKPAEPNNGGADQTLHDRVLEWFHNGIITMQHIAQGGIDFINWLFNIPPLPKNAVTPLPEVPAGKTLPKMPYTPPPPLIQKGFNGSYNATLKFCINSAFGNPPSCSSSNGVITISNNAISGGGLSGNIDPQGNLVNGKYNDGQGATFPVKGVVLLNRQFTLNKQPVIPENQSGVNITWAVQ